MASVVKIWESLDTLDNSVGREAGRASQRWTSAFRIDRFATCLATLGRLQTRTPGHSWQPTLARQVDVRAGGRAREVRGYRTVPCPPSCALVPSHPTRYTAPHHA